MINYDDLPHKFYCVELIPIRYQLIENIIGNVLFKFGITKHMKVEKRFDPKFNEVYNDFIFKVKFSRRFNNKQLAEQEESYWLNERFPNPGPNKVWLEKYLQCENKQRYNDSGITEVRLIDKETAKQVVKQCWDSLSMNEKQHKLRVKNRYYA